MITKNKTSIENELKKLNSNFNTFNKIMSSFLVIATTESIFKDKTKKEIKTIVPSNNHIIASVDFPHLLPLTHTKFLYCTASNISFLIASISIHRSINLNGSNLVV